MFRKLFLLVLIFMFYFWITDSKENVEKFKSIYRYIAGKLNKIDLEIDFSSKSKNKKW